MSAKTTLTIFIVAAIIVIVFIVLRGPAEAPVEPAPTAEPEASVPESEPVPTPTPAPKEEEASGETTTGKTIVVYTDSGYSPASVSVKAGATVTWRNQSSRPMWTASAVHPTHKAYPGSDIQLCGTAQGASIFDACQGVNPGGEWSFTFSERGTWRYHNHLQASRTGTIIVE